MYSVIAFAGFFMLLELALGVAGVQPRMTYDDPYVGFAKNVPLFVEEQGADGRPSMVTAPAKLGWFNRQRFLKAKPPGAFRIFSVGGSTTFGRPYDDRFSFSGWLREFLPEADPTREWEVINAGAISYASYRVAAVMEELARHEPDLFIIYSGHNEFLERRTYSKLIEAPEALTWAGGLLSRTRVYAAGSRVLGGRPAPRVSDRPVLAEEVDTMLAHSVGPRDYARDDEWRKQVLEHYRFNLRRMVHIARAAGAEALLVTPASNLKDCSPFKSEARKGMSPDEAARFAELLKTARRAREEKRLEAALRFLDEAAAIDDRHAGLHFERGRVLLALGNARPARAAFVRALDEDVCPLRALPSILEIIRQTSQETGAPLLDFAAHVESRSEHGIPGAGYFLDHVHLTVDGYRELALLLIEQLERMKRLATTPAWNDAAVERVRLRVESRLDRRAQGIAFSNLARVLGWAGKFEEAERIARQAIEQLGEDAGAYHALGHAAAAAGRRSEAINYFRKAIEIMPDHAAALTNLAGELLGEGKAGEAIPLLERALLVDPAHVEAHVNMGLAMAELGDSETAVRHYREALQIHSTTLEAHTNLGAEFIKLGRFEEALDHLRKALAIQPWSPDAHTNLGEALTRLGRLEEAESHLRQAIAAGPETAPMHYNLGVVLQRKGDFDGALRSYARALELDPKLTAARHNTALSLMALGRDEEAVERLRETLKLDPRYARAHPEIQNLLGEHE